MMQHDRLLYVLLGIAVIAAVGGVLIAHSRQPAAISAVPEPGPPDASPGVPAPGYQALAPNVIPLNRTGYLTRNLTPPPPSNSFIPGAGYSAGTQGLGGTVPESGGGA